MRVFHAIYVPESRLRSALDTIRVLYDPAVRHSAHITVRGPFAHRVSPPAFDPLKNQLVVLRHASYFFERGQHTVYLRAYATRLQDVWYKPNFDFAPHLTLYDGESRSRAVELYQLLTRFPLNVGFVSTGLAELISDDRGQTTMSVVSDIDFDFVSRITRIRLEPDAAFELPEQYKRATVMRLCRYLSKRSVKQTAIPREADDDLGLENGWSIAQRRRFGAARWNEDAPNVANEWMDDVLDTLWQGTGLTRSRRRRP